MKARIEVTWVRIAFVAATIAGFGSPILIYLILFALLEMRWIS